MEKPYLTEWKRYLQEQGAPVGGDDTVVMNARSTKKELIRYLQDLMSRMENSNDHDANTVAQIIVNNCNFFLLRQKDWADTTKYGPALFKPNQVKFLNSDEL